MKKNNEGNPKSLSIRLTTYDLFETLTKKLNLSNVLDIQVRQQEEKIILFYEKMIMVNGKTYVEHCTHSFDFKNFLSFFGLEKKYEKFEIVAVKNENGSFNGILINNKEEFPTFSPS